MATKHDLRRWIIESLADLGGSGSVVEVSKVMWAAHEAELRESGDLYYTWQYDVRWAAQALRNEGKLAPADRSRSKPWRLA
jgi:hypothetical protein